MRKVKAENYSVCSDISTGIVTFQGTLRLENTGAYTPIIDLLDELVEKNAPLITLDFRQLDYLNSSGINAFSKFFMKAQKLDVEVAVKGSKQIAWQSRMLTNIQRVLPKLQLALD